MKELRGRHRRPARTRRPVGLTVLCALAALLALARDGRADVPEAPPMRRLVLCLDGTWNNAERGTEVEAGRTRFKPTNVLKTYRAVVPAAPDGTTQIAYYSEGVGAFVGEPTRLLWLQKLTDRVFGGAYGGGFEGRVKSAYRFLAGNYRPGDEIYVFGFSRGAAQARSLVRFVDWSGGILHKEDEYYITELFSRFRTSRAGQGEAARLLAEIRSRGSRGEEAVRAPQPATIRFLGVYDTVLALGLRLRSDREEGVDVPTVAPRHAFHVGTSPPAIVEIARQALAIDEARWDYRPQVWSRPGSPAQSLAQRWFPGVHTNAGGGRQRDGVANVALHWMVAEAESAGLVLDDRYLGHFRGWFGDERPTRTAGKFRLIDTLRGKRGRGRRSLDRPAEAGLSVDPSALHLMLHDAAYRPANLLDHLAAHPEALEVVADEEKRAELARIVAGRRGG